jgi:hypothetical protein
VVSVLIFITNASVHVVADQRKPTCLRCEKGKFHCGGYAKPLHFRIAVPAGTALPQPQIAQEQTATIPESLSLIAFKPTFCYAYLFDNFVWTAFACGWLEEAATGKISPLAQKASSALSKSNFGNSHHQKEIKLEGSIDYGKTIQGLIPLLSNPTAPESEALLIPIILLTIHDSSFGNVVGVESHMHGSLRLLMVCGPQKFQQEPLRYAFESCRAMMTTGMLVARRRLFLEQDPWKTIPWALDPDSKTQQNHLGDILVMVPGFLEDDDALKERDDPLLHQNLIARVEEQLVKLYEWRWRWEMQNCPGVWEVSAADARPTELDSVHPLQFISFELSVEIMLYNSIQIWLFGLLFRLIPDHVSPRIVAAAMSAASRSGYVDPGVQTPLHLPGSHVSLQKLAIEIGQVFEYQSLQSVKSVSYWYLFPMGLAYSVLEHEEHYRKWLRGLLDLSPVTSGYIALDGSNETGFGFYLSSRGLRKVLGEGKD